MKRQRKIEERNKEEETRDNPKYKGVNKVSPNSIFGSRGYGNNPYYT